MYARRMREEGRCVREKLWKRGDVCEYEGGGEMSVRKREEGRYMREE